MSIRQKTKAGKKEQCSIELELKLKSNFKRINEAKRQFLRKTLLDETRQGQFFLSDSKLKFFEKSEGQGVL